MATIVADIIYKATEKGMSSVQKKLDGIDKTAKKSEKSSKGLSKALAIIAPLAVIAAVSKLTGAMAEMGRAAAKTGDEIVKTSLKLGVTTDKLQEWRFAAEEAGISQTTMDTSLQRFTRRLGEAQQGTGVLKTSLDMLGIGLTDATGKFKSTDDIMAEWMDKLKDLDKPQQLAHLTKGMDMAGASMSQMLDSLEGSRQKFVDMGLAIDKNVLKKMAVLNNDLGVMSIKQKTLATEIGAGFADITRHVEQWKILVLETMRDVMKLLGMMGVIHQKSAQDLADNLTKYKDALALQEKRLKVEQASANVNAGKVAFFKRDIANLKQEVAQAELLVKARIAYLEAGCEVGQSGDKPSAPTGGLVPEKEKILSIEEESLKVLMEHSRVQQHNNLLTQEAGLLFSQNAINLEEYILLLKNAGASADQLSLEPVITKNKEVLDQGAQDLIDWAESGRQGVRDLGDAFIESAFDGSKSFSEMAANILEDLAKMILQQLLFNSLKAGLSGTSFGGFLGFDKGGSFTPTKHAKGSEFSNKIHRSATKFAYGGGMGVMAEKSPEAVMPLARTNSGELGIRTTGSGDSGKSVEIGSINIKVEGNDNQSGAEQGQAISRELVNAINSMIDGRVQEQRRVGNTLNPVAQVI